MLLERNFRVFDDVVKKRGAERSDVELHVREEMRHFDGMREVRLAGKAGLRLVLLGGEIVGAAEEFEVVAGAVAAHFVDQLDEAQVHCATSCLGDGGLTRGFHKQFYRNSGG